MNEINKVKKNYIDGTHPILESFAVKISIALQ